MHRSASFYLRLSGREENGLEQGHETATSDSASRFGDSLDGRSAYHGSRKRRRPLDGMDWGDGDRCVCFVVPFTCSVLSSVL